jgi:hypothetical protein
MNAILGRAQRTFLTLFAATSFVGGAHAQSDTTRSLVEQILTRAVLERGAFLACARLDTSKQTADLLVRGWQLDLSEAGTILRAVGYSDDEMQALEQRFDVEKASPKFADLAALGAYCGVLGDWRTRWARLQILIPKIELRRALKPSP